VEEKAFAMAERLGDQRKAHAGAGMIMLSIFVECSSEYSAIQGRRWSSRGTNKRARTSCVVSNDLVYHQKRYRRLS
jgi:hypothetical protein